MLLRVLSPFSHGGGHVWKIRQAVFETVAAPRHQQHGALGGRKSADLSSPFASTHRWEQSARLEPLCCQQLNRCENAHMGRTGHLQPDKTREISVLADEFDRHAIDHCQRR